MNSIVYNGGKKCRCGGVWDGGGGVLYSTLNMENIIEHASTMQTLAAVHDLQIIQRLIKDAASRGEYILWFPRKSDVFTWLDIFEDIFVSNGYTVSYHMELIYISWEITQN